MLSTKPSPVRQLLGHVFRKSAWTRSGRGRQGSEGTGRLAVCPHRRPNFASTSAVVAYGDNLKPMYVFIAVGGGPRCKQGNRGPDRLRSARSRGQAYLPHTPSTGRIQTEGLQIFLVVIALTRAAFPSCLPKQNDVRTSNHCDWSRKRSARNEHICPSELAAGRGGRSGDPW